jgi:amidase
MPVMLTFDEYAKHDGLGLAELIARGEVSALEVLEVAIARIEAMNPRLNAVVYPMFDYARQAAARADLAGPFAGVPFLLKDLLSELAGVPHSSGSRFYRGYRPDRSSELTHRYLTSGVVVAGKTNTPELGLLPTTEPELWGATRNPWDPTRTTGGSSGGSAAAVASGMVPLASGGDGGGSIRIPCSCCGLFGLKPTRGRTPVGPKVAEDWHGLAVEHVLTRSVRDSAAMLDAVCGHYPGDTHFQPRPAVPFLQEATTAPGRLRIAWSGRPFIATDVHPEVIQALASTVALLEELGHEVEERAPVIDGALFAKSYLVVIGAHTWASIRDGEQVVGRKARRADFESKTWLAQLMGTAFSAGEYVAAVRALQRVTRPFHELAEEVDVLLQPTVSQPPPPLGFLDKGGFFGRLEKLAGHLAPKAVIRADATLEQASAESFAFVPWTPIYNVTGQPSMSVPLGTSGEGLPLGMMFTGRLGDEATLLRLAGQLEQARPWRDKRPPV